MIILKYYNKIVNILQWNVLKEIFLSSYFRNIVVTNLLHSYKYIIPYFNLFRQDRVDRFGGITKATRS